MICIYISNIKAPLLHDNLLHNGRFRKCVCDATSSNADGWYEFVTRGAGDVVADRRLLDNFNGSRLVDGSRALTVQEECRICDQELPGLCYPKARQNTGRNELCHACQVNEAIFYWIANCQLSNYSNQERMIRTIKDMALAAAGIPLDLAYPLQAPMNTTLNSICPYSMNKRACKSVDCSLRFACVSFHFLRLEAHC